MNIKISELNSSGQLTGNEVLPIVQYGNTVKTPISGITSLGKPYRTFVANVFKGIRDNIYNTTYNSNNNYTLKKGESYVITSYSSPDDFSNLSEVLSGNINEDGCIFKVTGDSKYFKSLELNIQPYDWFNNTELFAKGKLINEVMYNDFGYDLEWSFNYDSNTGTAGMTLSFPENIDSSKIEVQIRANNDNYDGTDVNYFTINNDTRPNFSNIDYNWGNFFDGMDSTSYTIQIQEDEKILIGGEFSGFYKNPSLFRDIYGIFRLNSDGSADDTFMVDNVGNGNVGFDNTVNTIKIQDDGKILVGGYFSSLIDGTYDNGGVYEYYTNYITRLNSDGTRDETFLALEYDGFDDTVWDINIDSDGKILVKGYFSQYTYSGQQYYINGIIRLNSDGSPDLNFLNNVTGFTGTFSQYQKVIPLDSGKILVSGAFDGYVDINGTHSTTSLIRLNNDGTLDETFNNTGFTTDFYGTAYLYDMKLQDDGKIVVGGGFQGYVDNQNTYEYARYLIRLTEDGEFDDTFYYDTGNSEGLNSEVYCIDITPEGQILVGGDFQSFNIAVSDGSIQDLYWGYMITLNENGLPACDQYTGVDSQVYSIKYCGNKKFYAGGYFSADYNGNLYPYYNGANFMRFNIENDVKVSTNFDNFEYDADSWSMHVEIKVFN